MLKESLFAICIGLATANICNDGTGTWSFSIVDGVTDFAYGGVPLNNNYNCFEGCLNTQTAVQDFKVSLNGTVPPTVASLPMLKQRKLGSKASRLARLQKYANGLVKTLLFNLNRPGWAINCVDFNDFALGTFLKRLQLLRIRSSSWPRRILATHGFD
ncbi:hypothetical protein COOONC_15064 [Cooperia oncophora]